MKKIVIVLTCLFVCVLSGCNEKANVLNETYQNSQEVKEEYLGKEEVSDIQEESNEPETVSEEKTEKRGNIEGKIILVDAGHGIAKESRQELIAPDSVEKKPAFVSGTRGKNQTEEELNLNVALKLEKALKECGATVYMTRTTHETDVSNIGRAELGNDANADISVKIHADGNNNTSVKGVCMLVPGNKHIKDGDVIKKSRRAGEIILAEVVNETKADNRGISVRNDMTGFNWSKVPVILLEMGFMTNPEEDKLLETSEYQDKIVRGIVNGLEIYFSGE